MAASNRVVYFDWQEGAGWEEIDFVLDSLVITKRAINDDLHSAQSVASFILKYDATKFADIMNPTNHILVRIEDEGNSNNSTPSDISPQGRLLEDNLVCWLSFDEGSGTTCRDNSGNTNDCTLTNAPNFETGKSRYALHFNGTDEDGIVADDASIKFGSGDFSVSLWFQSNNTPGVIERMVNKQTGTQPGWEIGLDTNGKVRFNCADNGGEEIIQGDDDVSDGEWHHVVCIKDSSDIYMYIDNVLQADTDTLTGDDDTDNTEDLYIASLGGGGWYFDGLIDEVRIYSKVLTASEVNRLYQSKCLFTGYISPTRKHRYDGSLTRIDIEIEALDFSDYLDVRVTDITPYETDDILDPSDPTGNSILDQLLAEVDIGFDDNLEIDRTITIDEEIEVFGPDTEEDSVLRLMDTLLFEYGYALYFDVDGLLRPIRWCPVDSATFAFTFDDDNIVESVLVDETEEEEFDGAEVLWYEVGTEDNVLIYREPLPYGKDGKFAGYTVLNGTKYPVARNNTYIGATNRSVYQVYQTTGIEYKTNPTTNKSSKWYGYNGDAFESNFAKILKTSAHDVDYKDDPRGDLTKTEVSFGNKKSEIYFTNSSGSSVVLYYFNIYATVKYAQTELSYRFPDGENSYKTYTSRFVFDDTSADNLTGYLAKIIKIGKDFFEFESEEYIEPGTYVRINTGNFAAAQYGVIVEWDMSESRQPESGDLIFSYTVRSINSSYDSADGVDAYILNAMSILGKAQQDVSEGVPATPTGLITTFYKGIKEAVGVFLEWDPVESLLGGITYTIKRSTDGGVTFPTTVASDVKHTNYTDDSGMDQNTSVSDLADYRYQVIPKNVYNEEGTEVESAAAPTDGELDYRRAQNATASTFEFHWNPGTAFNITLDHLTVLSGGYILSLGSNVNLTEGADVSIYRIVGSLGTYKLGEMDSTSQRVIIKRGTEGSLNDTNLLSLTPGCANGEVAIMANDGTAGVANEHEIVRFQYEVANSQPQMAIGTSTFYAGSIITIQGEAGRGAYMSIFAGDGDGTDDVAFNLWGVGTPGSVANRERLRIMWDTSDSEYALKMEYNGTGSVRPIDIYVEGYQYQVYLDTNGRVGINTNNPGSKLDVRQTNASGAIPTLRLQQSDVSEEFIRFSGSAANGVLTQSLVDEGDQASEARQGWIQVRIIDAGSQITIGDYFIPFYSLSS